MIGFGLLTSFLPPALVRTKRTADNLLNVLEVEDPDVVLQGQRWRTSARRVFSVWAITTIVHSIRDEKWQQNASINMGVTVRAVEAC
jgi:hypothetical protein